MQALRNILERSQENGAAIGQEASFQLAEHATDDTLMLAEILVLK
jgi:hypothetical protein